MVLRRALYEHYNIHYAQHQIRPSCSTGQREISPSPTARSRSCATVESTRHQPPAKDEPEPVPGSDEAAPSTEHVDLTTEESCSNDGKNGAASDMKFDDLVDQFEKWTGRGGKAPS